MVTAEYGWSLTAISVVVSAALLWIFRRFSNQERVALAKRKIRAQLYAMRLYGGDPTLLFRAQKQLVIWNARYLGLMLRPAAIAMVPSLILFTQLDRVYANRPLAPGESAVVTAEFSKGTSLGALQPALEGRGVVVETPAVRIPELRQACWRVRAGSVGSGIVLLRAGGATVTRVVETGIALRYLPGGAVLTTAGPVRRIDVAYPTAHLRVFGREVAWLAWFLAIGLLTMLALGWAYPGLHL